MKKWKKWAIGIGSALIILGLLGYWGMNLAVSYTLKAFSSNLDTVASADSKGEGSVNPQIPDSQGSEYQILAPGEEAGTAASTTKDSGSQAGKADSGKSDPDVKSKPAASQVVGAAETSKETSKGSSGDKFAYSAEVTTDKAKAVEDSLAFNEKKAITTILLKKLSPSDIKKFMEMSGGGMTVEEKKAAKKVIMSKLSEDEYNELISIAAKYGLSEGKKYSETSK